MRIGGRWFRETARYGLALMVVVLAVLSRWLLEGAFGPLPLFITFYPAVLLAASVGGLGPGLVATALSALATSYWFVPPYGSFFVEKPNDQVAFGIFVGCSVALCILLGHLRRMQHVQAIRASQEAEVAMLDEGNVLTFLADVGSGKILLWGHNAERLYGYTAAEAVGRTGGDLMKTRFPLPLDQIREEFRATGQWFGDLVCTAKDGREVIVESRWIHHRNALGEPTEFMTFDVDVTARRLAEKALKESEAKFRTLFDTLPLGVWVLDPDDLRFVMFNDVAPRMLGYSREEFANLTVADIEADHDLDTIHANVGRARAGEGGAFETHHWTKTRELRDIWTVGDRIEIGGRTLVLAIMVDITERKRAEAALARTTERYRLLSDVAGRLLAAGDPMALVNELCLQVMEHLDCQVFFAAMADAPTRRLRLHAHAGISEEEMRKYRWIDYGVGVAGSVARDRASAVIENVPESSDPRTFIIKSWGILAYVSHPLLAEGQLLGVLSFGSRTRTRFAPDELELIETVADQVAVAIQRIQSAQMLRDSEQELRRAIGELERSNRELEQFAYIASHDLQEPLRQVRAFARLLDDRYRDRLDDAAGEYLRFVVDGAARMTALVQDLLAYSRVGVRQPKPELTSSREAVERAVANLQASIQETNARVTWDDLPDVVANGSQLVQLFQNLLGNAIKFRRDGVTPEVRIRVRAEPQRWVFSVVDNGIGIVREHHDRVFHIFQRLHGREKYPGTGIGLAICRKIVHHHDGEIWIESQPGEGTSFFFTLPRAGQPAGGNEPLLASAVSPPAAGEDVP